MDIRDLILTKSEYVTAIGTTLGIVGIVLAFIFYFRSKTKKKLSYQIRSFNLINEDISDLEKLEVLYNGNSIKNLTVSKIGIWNSGNVTIDKSDIVQLDILKISAIDKVEILEAEIISNIDTTNNFSLIRHENQFIITFDYIDSNQGCAIKVYHNGKSSNSIKITGKIKGSGPVQMLELSGGVRLGYLFKYKQPKSPIAMTFAVSAKIGWIFYLIAAVSSLIYAFYSEKYIALLGTAFCIFGTYVLFPKGVIPKYLQIIYSDER